jgi:CheY-like chemotaxis protein
VTVILDIGTAPSRTEAKNRPSLQILVAEDVLPNQIMTEILLNQAGHEVTIVENGAAAVEAARCGNYDLILMDLQMPVMDGLEATRQIRALPSKARDIPIVALTAHLTTDEIEDCYAAGMQAHLTKPISPAKLIEIITRLRGQAAPP